MNRAIVLMMLVLSLLLATGCTTPPTRDPFDVTLEAHRDAIVNDTLSLVAVPSSADVPGGPARALDAYLALAERLGLKTVSLDRRIGYVELGNGDEYIAVLGHLDTVPAGDGWTRSPWGEVIDGRLYGRGVLDDKGPMVAALHALAALHDSGVPLEKKVRIIAGTDEETDDATIRFYREVEPDPVAGFSPDGDFPVVYAEKGLLWANWSRTVEPAKGPVALLSLEGGSAPNVVPDRAEAVLEAASPGEVAAILGDAGCSARVDGRRVRVRANGTAGHGSEPELGVNALVRLAASLDRVHLAGDERDIVSSLNATFNRAPDGGIVGLADPDVSVNLGACRVANGTATLALDIRFPAPLTSEGAWEAVNGTASAREWNASVVDLLPPLRVDPEGPLVSSLLEIYQEETGDRTASPRSVGYTTYAKSLPNTVAFGPLRPGTPDTSHEPDESIGVADLEFQARCYARAIQALAGEDVAGTIRQG